MAELIVDNGREHNARRCPYTLDDAKELVRISDEDPEMLPDRYAVELADAGPAECAHGLTGRIGDQMQVNDRIIHATSGEKRCRTGGH